MKLVIWINQRASFTFLLTYYYLQSYKFSWSSLFLDSALVEYIAPTNHSWLFRC